MPNDTFASFSKRVDVFVNGITDPALKAAMTKIGVAAKADATAAASADLGGDPKFSGWAPILETRFDHVGEGRISFHPTRRAAGPWTVAEFGRNSTAGPRMIGPRITKTGKVSKAKQKRWNGRTAGKGTATAALAKIEAATPDRYDKEIGALIRKAFG
jgi:hypothetical protein